MLNPHASSDTVYDGVTALLPKTHPLGLFALTLPGFNKNKLFVDIQLEARKGASVLSIHRDLHIPMFEAFLTMNFCHYQRKHNPLLQFWYLVLGGTCGDIGDDDHRCCRCGICKSIQMFQQGYVRPADVGTPHPNGPCLVTAEDVDGIIEDMDTVDMVLPWGVLLKSIASTAEGQEVLTFSAHERLGRLFGNGMWPHRIFNVFLPCCPLHGSRRRGMATSGEMMEALRAFAAELEVQWA